MKKIIMITVAVIGLAAAALFAGESSTEDLLFKAKQSRTPVMLEVGSTKCIPCRQMQPIMKQLEDEYKGKLAVLFLDINKERNAALKLGVRGIPTQIFYDKNGNEFHRHIGFYPYEEIKPVLKKIGL